MRPLDEMVAAREPKQSILATMPDREPGEQIKVWAEGLTRMLSRAASEANTKVETVIEYVAGGQLHGLFYDPLDEAEAYIKTELRRSRSREEGERKRQGWLMDVLVMVGAARVAGTPTLIEYPPAAAMMAEEPAANE